MNEAVLCEKLCPEEKIKKKNANPNHRLAFQPRPWYLEFDFIAISAGDSHPRG